MPFHSTTSAFLPARRLPVWSKMPSAFAGFDDSQVNQARQEFAGAIDPSPLRMFFSSARSSQLITRTNVELQRMARGIVWGDLDDYVRRVEALDGGTVRDAVARLLHPDRAILVRIEPMR